MCQISPFRYVFLKSSERVDPDSCIYVNEIIFNLISQGNETLEIFSKEAYEFQNFGNETLSLITNMLRNLHLIDWLQNYGSKKAVFGGEFALLNQLIWMNIKDYLCVNHICV